MSRTTTATTITTTAETVVRAAWSHVPGYERLGFEVCNLGFYPGTRIPIRKVDPATVVRVDTETGAVTDDVGGWVGDRLGPLGARQIRRLLAALE